MHRLGNVVWRASVFGASLATAVPKLSVGTSGEIEIKDDSGVGVIATAETFRTVHSLETQINRAHADHAPTCRAKLQLDPSLSSGFYHVDLHTNQRVLAYW